MENENFFARQRGEIENSILLPQHPPAASPLQSTLPSATIPMINLPDGWMNSTHLTYPSLPTVKPVALLLFLSIFWARGPLLAIESIGFLLDFPYSIIKKVWWNCQNKKIGRFWVIVVYVHQNSYFTCTYFFWLTHFMTGLKSCMNIRSMLSLKTTSMKISSTLKVIRGITGENCSDTDLKVNKS